MDNTWIIVRESNRHQPLSANSNCNKLFWRLFSQAALELFLGIHQKMISNSERVHLVFFPFISLKGCQLFLFTHFHCFDQIWLHLVINSFFIEARPWSQLLQEKNRPSVFQSGTNNAFWIFFVCRSSSCTLLSCPLLTKGLILVSDYLLKHMEPIYC